MKVIYKYQLAAQPGIQQIQIPINASIIKIAEQLQQITFWTLHEPLVFKELKIVKFLLVYTGRETEIQTGFIYADTVEVAGLVYHIFVKNTSYK